MLEALPTAGPVAEARQAHEPLLLAQRRAGGGLPVALPASGPGSPGRQAACPGHGFLVAMGPRLAGNRAPVDQALLRVWRQFLPVRVQPVTDQAPGRACTTAPST